MELINNTTKTLRDDLAAEIKQGSKLSIAAACFSIYAFQELKKELQGIDELRFIFTSPTFTTEKTKKERREFYIPRLNRERSLYGTEFEVKLRNELTQKAIAKECAEWIRQKVTFKSNVTNENMMGFEKWYASQSDYRTVEDQELDADIMASTYGLPEIARMLGVHRQTIYYIVASGNFELIKVGRYNRATKESFEKWYQNQTRYRLVAEDGQERR